MARRGSRGEAGPSAVWCGSAGPGLAVKDGRGTGTFRHGGARRGLAVMVKQGEARSGTAWRGRALQSWMGGAWLGVAVTARPVGDWRGTVRRRYFPCPVFMSWHRLHNDCQLCSASQNASMSPLCGTT